MSHFNCIRLQRGDDCSPRQVTENQEHPPTRARQEMHMLLSVSAKEVPSAQASTISFLLLVSLLLSLASLFHEVSLNALAPP